MCVGFRRCRKGETRKKEKKETKKREDRNGVTTKTVGKNDINNKKKNAHEKWP